ncbi:hypothetical protein DJ69_07920 [Halorubrum persicum]|uniref:DNA primase DNAG catalytic core N-terminal domain-containing protein n=1 Tax=Halorubrum persicum TaxID=1383844 RepID=A0A2G1WJF0_9EURY|nr:hypothetical protein [Halorubrum persicum]PHQ39106.1 hypothetical protein DJ69_07920 [Halorubrum persicum]
MTEIDRGGWRRILTNLKEPAIGAVAEGVADVFDVGILDAYDLVEEAVADGDLVEEDTGGAFPAVRVAEGDDAGGSPDSGEKLSGEGGSSTGDPKGEAAETAVPDALDAFNDAITWFAQQLDTELPDECDYDTARDYYRDGRGWDDETIDEKLLGFAPANYRDELVTHLFNRGHGREEMLATGLFGERDDGNLYATWSGRYVLPYFDADGRPVFAISRATDPVHPADWKGNKYDKLQVSREEVAVEEPIYGLDTAREGEPVIITEGIADAITAHQNGIPALSPVTTTFKKSDREALLDVLESYNVPRVYIVQDAEAPSSAIDENDRLTLPQYGEGIRGAVSTGAFLTEEGVDARIAELPRPGLSKVDLDDYLIEWCGDLAPVLASAAPATEHPAYMDRESGRTSGQDRDTSTVSSSDDRSALFDLDITDVTGLSEGERGTNPLGHHGESEDYFVVISDELATDHKYGASYNALTYLLVEAGERRPDAPDGSLDDGEVFEAWRHAKEERYVGSEDPVPYRGLIGVAVADGLVDADDLVRRDSETGSVVGGGEDHDGATYRALPAGAYNQVLDHITEEYGLEPGREAVSGRGGDGSGGYDDDPRSVSATVDVRRAWGAAGRVEPSDLDGDRLQGTDQDGGSFACPECGSAVDVVRAVAVAEGIVEKCDAGLDHAYPEAYGLARTEYGAPLPEYLTTGDAIAEFDAVLDVIGEVGFFHLEEDALASETTGTGEEVSGEAVRTLNPAWRESESGESVLVYESGTVWDADTQRVVDALRFVALDSGLLTDPRQPLEGEDFTEAYRRARTEYGAPLPRWEPAADGARELTPQLPPSDELVDAREFDGVSPDELELAREEVEALIGEAATDTDEPTVVTALPATGKTTGTVKNARDRPLSYLAPRKELQAQALEKADRWGVDAEILPVLSEERVRPAVLDGAVSHVREAGKTRLRDRWSIVAAAFDGLEEEDAADVDMTDIFEETEEGADTVELNRATCPTAEGDHGAAWAIAVHVARRLGYTPEEIHNQAQGLFGAPLPCTHDEEEECEYSEGWNSVQDPDNAPDLLVGSYIHAHVASVRTHFSRAGDGTVDTAPRAVVLDEFPGEAFVSEFGENAEDFATWLAGCLRDHVDDRRDMLEADLSEDRWVRGWLDGDAAEADDDIDDAITALGRTEELLDARENAVEILVEVDREALEDLGLLEPLEAVTDRDTDAEDAYGRLLSALGAVDAEQPGSALAGWVDGAVREPLEVATAAGTGTPEIGDVELGDLPVASDLRALVEDAVDAARERRDGARAVLDAAVTALRGGAEGCRRLAAWADDGYAHPDAHHILGNIVEPQPTRINTSGWAFDPDATDGTVVDVADTGDRAVTVLDRNSHGARLHTPPARTDAGGEDVPLVGLDATGRAPLWSVALGEEVVTDDIHDTPRERARFLENALDLRVLQAADQPRAYSGDPSSKDTDGDVALLEAIAEEYAGIDAPRRRGEEAVEVGRPAAITTKSVREVLEDDARLDDVVAEWDHYGNVTGSNDLGAHRLAAVLGSQHYGDDAIERFCALAGEEVDTERNGAWGSELDYGSDLANTYLKHMREDQTTQAILRFARGDSGATVVARTSALRDDLPVVGRGQVVETWSDTAAKVAREYRRLGGEFTIADVADAVDVSRRQVRRVLAELSDAGYIRRVDGGDGLANVYEPADEPGAGEVDLPDRDDAVDADPGRSPLNQYYTWNVRVFGGEPAPDTARDGPPVRQRGAPPSPTAVEGAPGD